MRKQILTTKLDEGEEEVQTVKTVRVRASYKKVPEENKDEKYWARREVNTIASKRCRVKNNLIIQAMVKKAKKLEAKNKALDEKIEREKESIKMKQEFIAENCQESNQNPTL